MIDKKISNYVKPLTYTYIRLREAKQNENRQEHKKNNKWIKGENYE